ncbi:hypothetical protein vseg_015252 [Gypsophila vaccaria]
MMGLAWNFRGLNDPLAPTISKIRALNSINNYDFMFLSETKCKAKDVSFLCRSFGFVHYEGVDALGTKGGLWLGWRNNVCISISLKCKNFVLCRIDQCKELSWYLCCVYGDPRSQNCLAVWNEIGLVLGNLDKPFLLLGDFNQVEYSWDKMSRRTSIIEEAEEFLLWKQGLELVDLPFKGPKFTWCNNRKGPNRVYERIDKAFGSSDWLQTFPNSAIKHYPIQICDHAPIEFNDCLVQNKKKRPYKLEAWNFDHEECTGLIKTIWYQEVRGSAAFSLVRKLTKVRLALRKWSLDKKKVWRKDWSEFDDKLGNALEDCFLRNDENEYVEHHQDLVSFASAAAKYWKQSAKIKWLAEGDLCTKYFFN